MSQELNQAWLVHQYQELVSSFKKYGLDVTPGCESFSATNVKHLKLGEYSSHWIFITFRTVQEGMAYLSGLEDGQRLSKPEKERK